MSACAIAPAHLGQVIEDRAAGDAATDDHDPRMTFHSVLSLSRLERLEPAIAGRSYRV